MRFLFYSHDGVGLGHVRRHVAIATALAELSPAAKVLLATGVDEVAHLGLPPNVDALKLPGLRKVANNQYTARRLGLAGSEICALRSKLLQAAVESFRPGVVLVDKHAFGVGGEFRAALDTAKAFGARAVLGLRDILDDPVAVLKEWNQDRFQARVVENFDLVLVYGQQAVFDPIEEYQFPPALAKQTRFCGYVLNQSARAWRSEPYSLFFPQEAEPRPIVLATTGGGEDGFNLLKTFIQASADAPWKGVAVAGPLLADRELKNLQNLALDNRVRIHTFIPCLSEFFSELDALVCMGGYNTLLEAVGTGVPTISVPRASPRSEQVLRAAAFERLGLVSNLHPGALSPDVLRARIDAVLSTPRDARSERGGGVLRFDGAQRAAEYLLGLIPANGPRRGRLLARTP